MAYLKLYSKRFERLPLVRTPHSGFEISVGLLRNARAVTLPNSVFSLNFEFHYADACLTYDAFIQANAPERAFEKEATHHCILASIV